MSLDIEKIKEALGALVDPVLGVDLKSANELKGVELNDKGELIVSIELGYPAKNAGPLLGAEVARVLEEHGVEKGGVSLTQNIIAHKVQGVQRVKTNVRNVLAVSSGKGGVGKSTVATNLALALAHEGARVAILDADIYGPSIPKMLKAGGQPYSTDGKTMEPFEKYGLQLNSIGFHINEDDPMIWRGPMASGALEQLFTQTNWHDVDYLVVDMPPGTGDIQLTLSQNMPVTAAVVVTTPQDIALIDAIKGLKMFQKVGVPLLGVVENMSAFVCPKCGEVTKIFGEGGARRMSETYGVPLLGELPLAPKIREQADEGDPVVHADPECSESKLYRELAMKVAGAVAKLPRDYTAKMPGVKVVGKDEKKPAAEEKKA